MEMQYHKWHSPALNREMECKVYGRSGRPMLFVPCQDGRFFDFENFHMADTLAPWIDEGQLMVFSIDTIDRETWSNTNGNPRWRIERHEQWIRYIIDEMAPFMRSLANECNGWTGYPGIMVFGCSLGALHAANLYFRFPDVFDCLLALSGVYSADYGFGGYMDDLVYLNSPVHYLENMSPDHPYLKKYNVKKAVFCVGQGPWELPEYTRQLQRVMESKGIEAWVDYWGYDCAHDWDWWYKQAVYFMPYLLGKNQG